MHDPGDKLFSRAEIARLAGVRRPAVSNWERRHPDTFPRPVSTRSDGTELFRAAEIVDWLDRRAVPANARESGEAEGTTYGDRFRAALEKGATAPGAPPPPSLPQAVERMLARHRDVPLPEYVEMVLALLHLRGSRPDVWRSLTTLVARAAGEPRTVELQHAVARGLPEPLSPTVAQAWRGGGRTLTELIRSIDSHGSGERSECVAAFDRVIELYARTGTARAAEFLTPPSVARTAAELLVSRTDAGEVYDPFCRTGEMLAAVVDAYNASGRNRPPHVSGSGVPDFLRHLARLNLGLRGHERAELTRGAATPSELPAPIRRKVDLLVANPPFNVRSSTTARRTTHWRYGPPPPHRANFDWLQYAVDSLSDVGRACVVMAPGATFSTGREKEIRTAMVEDGAVECVVELPPGLFSSTGIAVTLWLLRAPTGNCEEVLFVNARDMGAMVTRSVRSLSDPEIDSIAHEYHAWRGSDGTHRGTPGFSRAVGLDEIRANGHALAPPQYVLPTAPVTDGPTALRDRLGRLTERLARLHGEATRIDATVESMLRRHGV